MSRGRGWGAPMPDEVRNLLRARQHPARAVECPHCGAHPHRPCIVLVNRRRLTQPHPARITAWVRTVAACPACESAAAMPCRDDDGRQLPAGANHPQRDSEAEVTP